MDTKLLRDALNVVDAMLAELTAIYAENDEFFSLTDSGEQAIAVLNHAIAAGWVDLADVNEMPNWIKAGVATVSGMG